jgi:hypothetical protein
MRGLDHREPPRALGGAIGRSDRRNGSPPCVPGSVHRRWDRDVPHRHLEPFGWACFLGGVGQLHPAVPGGVFDPGLGDRHRRERGDGLGYDRRPCRADRRSERPLDGLDRGCRGGALLGRRSSDRSARPRSPAATEEILPDGRSPGPTPPEPMPRSVPTGDGAAAIGNQLHPSPERKSTPDADRAAAGMATAPGIATPLLLGPEAIRISERILYHLHAAQVTDEAGRAPVGLTQQGIQSALELRQGAVASALARMVAAGLVTSRLDHVSGRARRLKVYRLTPLGQRLSPARPPIRPNEPAPTAPTRESARPRDR